MSQRKTTPFKQKLTNKYNNHNDLDDSPLKQNEEQHKENQQAAGNNFRLFYLTFAKHIQQKPKVKIIILSYVMCAFFNLLNAQSLSKFRNENQNEDMERQNNDIEQSKNSSIEENINIVIFQFIVQDYFIYTAVRLLFHDKLLRKIEISDLILSFWLFYISCSLSLLIILILLQSIWQNILVFTIFNTYLMYQYRVEQKLNKNLFQITQNVDQVLRSARRQIGGEDEDGQEEVNENLHEQRHQNNSENDEGDEYEGQQQEAVRLNQRRTRHTSPRGPRGNPRARELAQQFIGEHYERNKVCQLIQIGISKWLVVYKINHLKYVSIYINQGRTKLLTQKIDSNCIVLKYYWDQLNKNQTSQNNINQSNNNASDNRQYINIGVMYNTFTGRIMIFTVNVKGIKYLQILDIGVVSKEHIILHEQLQKFVILRFQEIVFRDLIKNDMSSQTLGDYPNRKLQLYYSIENTDNVICTQEETLIISSINSIIEWKQNQIGNDWELELMNAHSSNNHQNGNTKHNFSYQDKKQYFILGKTKTYNFPTNIKSVNILNRRHLFIQDESNFYVYSIPTQQVLHTLSNKYVDGYQIIPIYQTVNSPNLTIDQFLKIQNCIQKIIAEALSKFLPNSNTAITNEDPAAIYHSQYTSIPITLFFSSKNNQTNSSPTIFFIQPKQIQEENTSPLFTQSLFQIQERSLQNILSQVDEKKQ